VVGLYGAVGPSAATAAASAATTTHRRDDERVVTHRGEGVYVERTVRGRSERAAAQAGTDGPRLWVVGTVVGWEGEAGHVSRPADRTAREFCLARYRDHGPAFVERLNGSFVVVVHDERAERVLVATDRLGSRPVFLTETDDGTLVFADRIQRLAEHPAVDPAFDHDYLAEYLGLRRSFGVRTPLSGVRALHPGSVATVDPAEGTVRTECYWRPRWEPLDRPLSWFVDRFVERWPAVVDDWIAAEGTTGLLLSGGADSRAVLAALPDDADVTLYHFSDWMNREARTTERVANQTDHPFVYLQRTREEPVGALERNAPLSNFDGWATQFDPTAFDALRDADVLVSGLYADLLFGGYQLPTADLPTPFGDVSTPVGRSVGSCEAFVDHLAGPRPPYLDGVDDPRTVVRRNVGRDGDGVDHHGVRYRSLREAVFCGGFYPLSNEEDGILARSLARYRPFRTPFLDNRMVELALRLPAAYHLRRDVVSRAVDRLAPELAALPDASTGLPLSTSMPVRFVGGLANALRRKVSPWATPPRPYLDHGPWLNLGELVRHDDWFERRLRRRRDRVERLPFLSWDGAVTTYEDHLAGTNRTSELQTLLTLLELPVTEQVVATTR
jgi:asparagine synthase (glutamine-hydrolysing)